MAGVTGFSRELIDHSGYEGEGFALEYDRYRPTPPAVVLSVLMTHAGTDRPRLVVDLGCGTGLSTRAWAGHAMRVIGVEANAKMVAQARAATGAANVEFVEASLTRRRSTTTPPTSSPAPSRFTGWSLRRCWPRRTGCYAAAACSPPTTTTLCR
jgi:SAM-dependent methyltransferase